jgi:hypothetical protein
MEITIPTVLKSLSTAGTAATELTSWWRTAKGNTRSLIGELKDNLTYLDMVADDGVAIEDVIEKISISEYKRLNKEGFSFNSLKRTKIASYSSLKNTDLSSWPGKDTGLLVESIYQKINDLKLRYPHLKNNPKYRWPMRVQNIRKRIWLLLKHVNS